MNRKLLEYRPEVEALTGPVVSLGRAVSSAADERRNAAELLERLEEGELEAYLVELIDRAGGSSDQRLRRALASTLGHAARRLFRSGSATTAAAASRIFGLELEGLSAEDQSFEIARHFVRFASEAARRLGRMTSTGSPLPDARRAVTSAARTLAPGLLPASAATDRSTGVWFRRANELVVLNP